MASQTDITQKHILRVFRKHFLYSKILLQRGHIVLQQTASLNLGAFCNIATLPHCNIAIYLAVKLEGSGKSHDGEQERKDLHFKINPFSVTKITVPATI